MSRTLVEQIRGALAQSRSQADRILQQAAEDARELERGAEVEARRRGEARLREIEELRASIELHSREIERAYVRMVEALAATSMRLVEIAREADFSPPPWPGGLARTVEVKLSETREITFRLARGSDRPGE